MARTIQWPALALALGSLARSVAAQDCPGYSASNVDKSDYGLTADLTLAGDACNLYGDDIKDLRLIVEYQTDSRLHVLIQDADEQVYQIQEDIIARPPNTKQAANASDLAFSLVEEPFSFSVSRRATGEVLFNTNGSSLIFESQYLRLRTALPANPNIYGLGEHSDSFRLPAEDSTYQRTMWNAEAAYIPRRSNLYASHPSYFEHRATGTHGVLFLNANGMDIKFNNTGGAGSLEYNTIGGVFDFYFFSGPDPTSVTQQHAEALGLPAMVPYWSLGFHQAKYGYANITMLEEVVTNYSKADIPLEVIWADIDYMQARRDFTIDKTRFDPARTKSFVSEVQERGQRFVMILDPGIAPTTAGFSGPARSCGPTMRPRRVPIGGATRLSCSLTPRRGTTLTASGST
jgi:alpha-glucosidase